MNATSLGLPTKWSENTFKQLNELPKIATIAIFLQKITQYHVPSKMLFTFLNEYYAKSVAKRSWRKKCCIFDDLVFIDVGRGRINDIV